MDLPNQLLLNVWREVCRHIAIEESVSRAAPLLVQRLPLDELLIRSIDVARSCLETVAVGMAGPVRLPTSAKSECAAGDLERILGWCSEGNLLRASDQVIQKQLPGLLPPGLPAMSWSPPEWCRWRSWPSHPGRPATDHV